MQLICCRELGIGVLLALGATVAQAQITTDGTMGRAGALQGPNYQIPAELGQQRGGNLFHSFGTFNVYTSESATFSGPNSVQNILSRVTGGSPSAIDGTLRSTIPGANLYLLNPAGAVFGPNATLDVSGSFHTSTADYVRLGQDGLFDTRGRGGDILTTAPVTAFGFLSNTSASIKVLGSRLEVAEGKTLSVTGGNIRFENSTLRAPSGRLDIAAVASPGEVVSSAAGLETSGINALGNINLVSTKLDVSGNDGGAIFIRGDQLLLTGQSSLRANADGATGSAGQIRVTAPVVELREGSGIYSDTYGSGAAGAIELQVDRLLLDGRSRVGSSTFGSGQGGSITVTAQDAVVLTDNSSLNASSESSATGAGGRIRVTSPVVELQEGSAIRSDTAHTGAGGAVELQVDRLLLNTGDKGGLTTATSGSGPGGTLTVTAREAVTLTGGSSLFANSLEGATGAGGRIRVTAPVVEMRDGSGILSDARSSGAAGAIELQVDRLLVSGRSQVGSSTFGSGQGGPITVTARDAVVLTENSGLNARSGVNATGAGGRIRVTAPIVAVRDSSAIQSDTAHTGVAGAIELQVDRLLLDTGGKLATSTSGSGNGGPITVTAREAVTLTRGSGLYASSRDNATGAAGRIQITAPVVAVQDGSVIESNTAHASTAGAMELQVDRLLIGNNSGLATATSGNGPGGTLTVNARESVTLTGGSSLFANALEGAKGAGGRIRVTAPVIEVRDGSGILSDTYGSGAAGAIELQMDRLLVDGRSQVGSSTFGSGQGGPITVTARDAVVLTENSGLNARSGANATGAAGQIRITAPIVAVRDGSVIESDTAHTGAAGAIELQVDRLLLDTGGKLATSTSGSGDGGQITVTAREAVSLARGSGLSASSQGNATGAAGRIQVTAPVVAVWDGSFVKSDTANADTAGAVVLQVDRLLIGNNSGLTTATSASGPGGTLTVTARESVTLTGRSSLYANSSEGATGSAGHIRVTAPVVEVRGGSGILSDTYGIGKAGMLELQVDRLLVSDGSNIATATFGSGQGGDIKITASDTVLLTGNDGRLPSRITVRSTTPATGRAGDITLNTQRLILDPGTTINAASDNASGGIIEITARDLRLHENSDITTSVFGDLNTVGGNVTLNADRAVIWNGAKITAKATQGKGGVITVNADIFLQEAAQPVPEVLDASSEVEGNDGVVELNAPNLNLAGTMVRLPVTYLTKGLNRRCVIGQEKGERGSFRILGKGTVIQEPEESVSPNNSGCSQPSAEK